MLTVNIMTPKEAHLSHPSGELLVMKISCAVPVVEPERQGASAETEADHAFSLGISQKLSGYEQTTNGQFLPAEWADFFKCNNRGFILHETSDVCTLLRVATAVSVLFLPGAADPK